MKAVFASFLATLVETAAVADPNTLAVLGEVRLKGPEIRFCDYASVGNLREPGTPTASGSPSSTGRESRGGASRQSGREAPAG